MEKITVQHFLNKDLNPQISGKIKRYPVYVQVITLRKNLRFKSNNINFEYLSDEELDHSFMHHLLEKEKSAIASIVRDLITNNNKDLITSKNLSLYSKRMYDVIEYNFCKLLLREKKEFRKFVPDLFLGATYSEIIEVVYFYNDNSPLSNISYIISDCLNAFDVLYPHSPEDMDKYYVYDLFEGSKKNEIAHELNAFNGGDVEDTNKMLNAMQELSTL